MCRKEGPWVKGDTRPNTRILPIQITGKLLFQQHTKVISPKPIRVVTQLYQISFQVLLNLKGSLAIL